jgi:capsule polysaccharide export protein KpsE/RkpR
MGEQNNLLPLLKVWAKWKKIIGLICLLTGVGAIVVSLFLADYFKSTTVFYPASSDVQKPDKIFGFGSETLYYYGTSEDGDRVLSVGESEELKDFLIQKFNLFTHYNVDSTTAKGRFLVKEILNSQYKIQRNRYDAIELMVEDTDPKVARDMALAAREKINTLALGMVRKSQAQIIKTFEQSINAQQKELAHIEDSLRYMRSSFGIYNPLTQSKILTDLSAIADARLARTRAQVAALEKEPNANRDTIIMMRSLVKGLENEVATIRKGSNGTNAFNKGVSTVEVLTQVHEQTRKQLSFDVVRLQQMKAATSAEIAAIYVIEEPRVADRKERPKRMIIVAVAILAAFVFSTIGILLFENYKNIDWQALRES